MSTYVCARKTRSTDLLSKIAAKTFPLVVQKPWLPDGVLLENNSCSRFDHNAFWVKVERNHTIS